MLFVETITRPMCLAMTKQDVNDQTNDRLFVKTAYFWSLDWAKWACFKCKKIVQTNSQTPFLSSTYHHRSTVFLFSSYHKSIPLEERRNNKLPCKETRVPNLGPVK